MTRIDNVKNHVRENKKVYIAVGVGIVIGAVSVTVIHSPKIVQTAVTHGDHSPIIQIAQPIRRGHPGFVVRIKETGEVVASKRRAAEMLGVHHTKLDNLVDVLGEAK